MNIKKLARIKMRLDAIRNPAWDRKLRALVDDAAAPTVLVQDGTLILSAEDGHGFADFYGEFSGGYPTIDPRIQQVAADEGCFWEWRDPGSLVLAE